MRAPGAAPPASPPTGVPPGALVNYARDVPKSCYCLWDWKATRAQWVRVQTLPGCPWCDPYPKGMVGVVGVLALAAHHGGQAAAGYNGGGGFLIGLIIAVVVLLYRAGKKKGQGR